MTVLMFGWEFPPHMSGGLGTACFGLTNALTEEKTTILFVVPKAHGDEVFPLINASDVLIDNLNDVQDFSNGGERVEGLTKIHIPAALTPYGNTIATDTIEHWSWQYPSNLPGAVRVGEKVKYEFTGKYGLLLMDEVTRYADVASKIATEYSFDVIHAHDWLTYPAAIRAQQTSGRPLIVHVHATEFDRAGPNSINERIFDIEKRGMDASDLIIAVSQWTKDILVERYGIKPEKVRVVHNGVIEEHAFDLGNSPKVGTHVVTFLGRITYQKGPEYFINAARKILEYFPETHFGSETLINIYRNLQTSDHFYYMSTKQGQDGNVHQYFSPYSSPYEAFMNYMNVIADLELRLRRLEAEIDGLQNRHPIAFVKV